MPFLLDDPVQAPSALHAMDPLVEVAAKSQVPVGEIDHEGSSIPDECLKLDTTAEGCMRDVGMSTVWKELIEWVEDAWKLMFFDRWQKALRMAGGGVQG